MSIIIMNIILNNDTFWFIRWNLHPLRKGDNGNPLPPKRRRHDELISMNQVRNESQKRLQYIERTVALYCITENERSHSTT